MNRGEEEENGRGGVKISLVEVFLVHVVKVG